MPSRNIPSLVYCRNMDSDTVDNPRSRHKWPVRDAKALGRALRDYRVTAGMSQSQLGQAIGVDRTYISELELGKETEQLRRLFAAFKVLGLRVVIEPGPR
jgi:DNA-binding XRE family transcriptional regulator